MKNRTTRSPRWGSEGRTLKPSRLALSAYQPMTTGPRETYLDGRAKLEALDTLLASDRVRPSTMSLSEIDGFLAALAVGPGPIPTPEDWMPVIWGEGEPPFADLDETWQVVDAVLSRVTDIYQQLREDPGAYRPVFRVTNDGAEIAAEWARGFWTGAQFRADVFEPLRRTPERWEAVVFIIMHMTDWDDMLPAGQSLEGLAEIRRRARTIIPGAVLDLCRFWRERDGGEPAPATGGWA
jgi:uncharacterized protein